jgi:hypothetical protein
LCLPARARRFRNETEARHYSRATSYFFTAAFQFVTIGSGGGDATEAFVVLVRKRVPSAATSRHGHHPNLQRAAG